MAQRHVLFTFNHAPYGSIYYTEGLRAVVGVVGFLDVPFVVLAIVLRRTQHPGPLIFEGGLTSSMLLTLLVCVAAFTILYVQVLMQRVSLREVEVEIAELRQA